jgi:hypothetical protein
MRKLPGRLFSPRALLAGAPAAALAHALGVVFVRNVTTPPTSVSEDPREPRYLIVHINGTDEPIVEVNMAEGTPSSWSSRPQSQRPDPQNLPAES